MLYIYKITFIGSGIQMIKDNEYYIDVGFIKNEYVIAFNKKNAEIKTTNNINKKIINYKESNFLKLKKLILSVYSVEICFNIFKLIFEEGFIFFPE